ncbi:MAG: AarF/UbiB family protein, partial [Rickettsiales bacterium]
MPGWLCGALNLLASPNLPNREGERLCLALEAMGPTFIKLGQALSTRADLMSEAVAEDLARLRDRLPPFSAQHMRKTVEADLEAPLDTLFAKFEEEPVAAASIAQVHLATTPDGEKVAVKVLRPGIRSAFTRDIALFYWIAEQLELRFPPLRRLKPVAVVETFEDSIHKELDLRMEAAAAETLRNNTLEDNGLYIPAIDWNRTAERVLTMERIEGIPISDVEAIKEAGHDVNQLLKIAADSLFQQVFRDGFFHADLHPGNLFVLPDGRLAAVDFGITGRIDKRNRIFIAEILRSFLQGDYRQVAEVHIAAGYVPSHHHVDDFALACMAIGKPVLGKPLQDISI